jgi:hypothetical protein
VKQEQNKKPQAIEIDDLTLERMKTLTTQTPQSLTHAHSRSGALVKPEDIGTLKGVAVSAMHQQTATQMNQLAEQIQLLAQQYDRLKKRIEVSERIYMAHIPFTPRMGQTYHLYAQKSGQDVLSLLSPSDWGPNGPPFVGHLARVRLLSDHTWEVLEEEADQGW